VHDDPGEIYNLASARPKLTAQINAQLAAVETKLAPHWVQPVERLAWVLATCKDEKLRDPRRSLGLAEKAASLTGRLNANTLATLAAAYAESGRPADAERTIEEAFRVARTEEQPELARSLEERRAALGSQKNRTPDTPDAL
jgi:hypothetical protein